MEAWVPEGESDTHSHHPDHHFEDGGEGSSAPGAWNFLYIPLNGSGKRAPWGGSEAPATGDWSRGQKGWAREGSQTYLGL